MQANFQERGRAALEVDLVFNQSTITGAYATSPMKLLTPRSRGQSVCTYASNFGGGLVAGDETRLELRVGKGARCFLGTQASTKIYRNPHLLPCGHVTCAEVEADALLVFAPAPVQPFADSSYSQRQEFRLAPGAGLALLDWFTSGRAACGERWAFAKFSSRNEVWRDAPAPKPISMEFSPSEHGSTERAAKDCLFLDSLSLDSTEGPLAWTHRTGRFNCFAMLLLLGPPLQTAAVRLLEDVSQLPIKRRGSLLISASPVADGVVLRVAGEEVGEVDGYLRRQLSTLSSLLGEDPWCRRW
jgi:urease accessory protein